jgi:antitoxin MazE
VSTATIVSKLGNGLAVRLPKSIVREAHLREGDAVDISVDSAAIVIRSNQPRCSLDELVGRITAENRHGETNWARPR